VILFVRPNIIATKRVDPAELGGLQDALDVAIGQVREKREKLKNY